MNFRKLYDNLLDELKVFKDGNQVENWLISRQQTVGLWNYKQVIEKGNNYIASQIEKKVQDIVADIEIHQINSIAVHCDIVSTEKSNDMVKATGIGAAIGLGAAVLLGAAAFPLLLGGAIIGCLTGSTKSYRKDVIQSLVASSNKYAEEYYKRLEPFVRELKDKIIDVEPEIDNNYIPITTTNIKKELYNSEQIKIKEFLEKHNIKYLVHFTDTINVNSIKEFGLLSIDEMNKRGISYKRNDMNRLDNKTNFISLSITNPNKIMYQSYKATGRIGSTSIIYIDACILFKEIDTARIYCDRNAAASSCVKGTTIEYLEKMFCDKMSYSTFSNMFDYDRVLNYREDNEPTDPQAEILFCNHIDKKYIINIERLK